MDYFKKNGGFRVKKEKKIAKFDFYISFMVYFYNKIV